MYWHHRTPGSGRTSIAFLLPFLAVFAAACDIDVEPDAGDGISRLAAEAPSSEIVLAGVAVGPPDETSESPTVTTVAETTPRVESPEVIRGLYLNAYAAGSSSRLRNLIDIADRTEINTFVIDVKDENGVHYPSEIPLARQLTASGTPAIRNLHALLDSLGGHGIYRIARIVVFNDQALAGARPAWTIRQEDGSVWRDRSGNSWVSPWDPEVWEYNLAIAEEVARAGFDEIQFDYIRFPEQFRSLPPQIHPHADGDRTEAIVRFLVMARERLHPLGVRVAADVFGLSPNTYDDVGIGQQWERLAAVVDHILPMMYPSHYYSTHLPNVANPHAMPYETILTAAGLARIRNDRMREAGLAPGRVITWLQAFQAPWLRDGVDYGPAEIRSQKQGLYDVGLEDWILWHPGSQYGPFVEGLDNEARPMSRAGFTPPAHLVNLADRWEELGVRASRELARRTAPEVAGRAAQSATPPTSAGRADPSVPAEVRE